MALAGHFGGVPGRMRFYNELCSNQLRMELEKRVFRDCPNDERKVSSSEGSSVWGTESAFSTHVCS